MSVAQGLRWIHPCAAVDEIQRLRDFVVSTRIVQQDRINVTGGTHR
jgi:hypothetical protein